MGKLIDISEIIFQAIEQDIEEAKIRKFFGIPPRELPEEAKVIEMRRPNRASCEDS